MPIRKPPPKSRRKGKKKPTTQLKRKRDTRPSAARRGYDHAWTKRRKNFLKGKKRCSKCKKPLGAHPHVHHSGKGLQARCQSCHNRTSATNRHKNNRAKRK